MLADQPHFILRSQRPQRRKARTRQIKKTGSESRGDGVSTTDSVTTGSSERTGSQGYDVGIASSMETPTGSSNLSIFDYYRLVNHDANFTKYFSDEVAQKAEGLHTAQRRQWGPARRQDTPYSTTYFSGCTFFYGLLHWHHNISYGKERRPYGQKGVIP